MQHLSFWKLAIVRNSLGPILALALTACGGGEPSGNDQPEAPNQNDQGSQNTPPTIDSPASITLSNSGAESYLEISVSDAENNPVQVSWSIDSSPTNGDLAIDPYSGFLRANISATVDGVYIIGLLATDGIDSTRNTIQVEVSNQPPPILGLTIAPAGITTNDVAEVQYDNQYHVEAYYQQINYIWRINGVNIESNTTYLHPSPIKRGDSISVEVIASNGETEVRALSAEVIAANSPPQTYQLHLQPRGAGAGDDLNIDISTPYDPDGDEISITYQWFLNDRPLAEQNGDVFPAGVASAEDRIKVEVTLSDGIDSTVITSDELQLVDTPSSLIVNPSSILINFGSTASFSAKFVDADGDGVQTEFVEGPEGLSYDAGTHTAYWTPTPAMLGNEETFYAYFNSSDGQRQAAEIVVRKSSSTSIVARSGIPIPGSDFELDIGDFDGDGRTEVLSTDSKEHIFTLEFDGTAITQDWLYPFAVKPGESVRRLWAYGTGLSQILVVTTNGVSLIESRTQLPRRLLDTSYDIAASALEDFDGNGKKELLLLSAEGVMSKLNLENGSLSNFGETISTTEWPRDYYTIATGNIDNDPAIEIVVDTGQVIDGASGAIEWTHFNRFGDNITIGDVDGDGDTDIVAADRWENVTSYDPIAKTSIWSYNIDDFCSLRLYNVDADAQDELIAGPCQHGSVEIYDGSSGTMVLQDTVDSEHYNSSIRSYSFGDLDNDGVEELIFSTGSGSTAEDNMAVASLATLGDSAPGVVVNINPSQISGFKSIGWDTSTSEPARAVFLITETEGGDYFASPYGDDGPRLGLLSTTAEFTTSPILSNDWNPHSGGIVADTNADGVSEAVLGLERTYNRAEVQHFNLDDFALTHTHSDLGATNASDNPTIVSMSLGTDSDGSLKAIIATSEFKLQVYNLSNRQNVWTSGGLSGGWITDAIAINTTSDFDIAAATNSELTLWRKSDEGPYVKIFNTSAQCHFIQEVVISSEQLILCGRTETWNNKPTTLSLFSLDLEKQSEIDLDYIVTAISATPTGELLVGARNDLHAHPYSNNDEHTLRQINPLTGNTLWKSAPVLGEINAISFTDTPDGSVAKMAFSTSSAMYIVE